MQDNQLDPKVIDTNILSTYYTHARARAHARTHAHSQSDRQTHARQTTDRMHSIYALTKRQIDPQTERQTEKQTNKYFIPIKTLPYLYICKEFEKGNKFLYANNKVINKLKTIGRKDLLSRWKNAICKCVHET